MNRHVLQRGLSRGLTWALVATLILPVGLAVLAGLGGLLGSLGDDDGASMCGRLALAIGVLWIAAVVGTTAITALTALIVLDSPRPARKGRRRRRRRMRSRFDRRPLHGEPPERPT